VRESAYARAEKVRLQRGRKKSSDKILLRGKQWTFDGTIFQDEQGKRDTVDKGACSAVAGTKQPSCRKHRRTSRSDRTGRNVSFCQKKELTETKENIYVSLAVTRNPRQIAGFTVTESRSVTQMQNLIDCSMSAETYYSDGFSMYRDLCYWGVHIVAPGKSQTYTVEGINSDLRRYIAGFARRSKCFYRKIETVQAILSVFVSAYNRFGKYKHAHQVLAKHNPTSKSRLHKFSDLPLALIDFIV
jgi:IS1 family transposase